MKASTDEETYECPVCHTKYSIQRARGFQYAIGHKKMLYCIVCKLKTNHRKVED
jgi:hypothetical protein